MLDHKTENGKQLKSQEYGSQTKFDQNPDVTVNPVQVVYSTYEKGKIVNAYKVVIKPSRNWKTISYKSLPNWLQDNEFLTKEYRPQLASVGLCLQSIFRIHTETGNIWTHLLGGLALSFFAIYNYAYPLSYKPWKEKLVFGAFFSGAIICLLFSSFFHTMYCHSRRVMKSTAKLDYVGIATLVLGSTVPLVYYAFYCHLVILIVYETVAAVLGIAASIVSLFDKFSEAKYRTLRAGLFSAVGGSGIIPLIHYWSITGFKNSMTTGGVLWISCSGVFYLFGAFMYATRTPERYFPGRCDLIFQSHQIFHVCVVIGAVLTYCCLASLAEYHAVIGHNCTAVLSS